MNILKLSKLLIEKRGDRGVREFAREIGISAATLSRIERGKLPDIETFGKLCSVLKLDPADILGIEDIEAHQRPIEPRRGDPVLAAGDRLGDQLWDADVESPFVEEGLDLRRADAVAKGRAQAVQKSRVGRPIA